MAEIFQSNSQKLSQNQVLSPQMLRRLEVLHKPTEELEREVEAECEKNPLLEIVFEKKDFFEKERLISPEEAAAERSKNEEKNAAGTTDFDENSPQTKEFYSSKDEVVPAKKWSADDEKRREFLFNSVVQKESIYDVLERQIAEADVPAETKKILEKICSNLSEKGFFDKEIEDFAKEENLSKHSAEAALAIFQTFDPPGIGARNYRENYKIQLKRRSREDALAFKIVDKAYELFTKAKFAEIADKFAVPVAAVREAVSELAALKIVPADGFLEDTNRLVVPEIIFSKNRENGAWEAEVATRFCRPKIQASAEWKKRLLLGNVPEKDKKYFEEKIKAGEEFVANLKNRETTLARLGDEILKAQNAFFENGFSALQPMTQSEIAERIGVDGSTISRAVNGKFAETPWGVIELKRFFSTAIQGVSENVSNVAIKEMIREIIENEPKENPFSDAKISEILARKGVTTARRTVLKYRESLGIPSTYSRKRL